METKRNPTGGGTDGGQADLEKRANAGDRAAIRELRFGKLGEAARQALHIKPPKPADTEGGES